MELQRAADLRALEAADAVIKRGGVPRGGTDVFRQVAALDDARVGEIGGKLQHVAQLADIAGPVVALELGERVLADGNGPLHARGNLHQHLAREQRNVLRPLPQRRDADVEGAEPVVKVRTKTAVADGVLQIGVARREDADVDRDLLHTADRADGALLKRAQQLRLDLQLHLGNFVEQQRAALRRLEHAELSARLRAGERALHIAEKLGIERIGVEGGAVEREEHAAGAGACVMDGLRIDLLARAALRREQHRRVAAGDAAGKVLGCL